MQTIVSNTFEHRLYAQLLKLFHSQEQRRHSNIIGPKMWCNFQKFATLILYRRSCKPLRRFVQELHESKWPQWLKFRNIPSKSTIHNWFVQSDMRAIQREYIKLLRTQNATMAIDATGIDSWQRSRHYERRIGESYMPYAKLDILIDTESKLILDHVLRLKPRHDTVAATQLFKRCSFTGECLGDKGYDSEPLHEIARQNQIELLAPVRASSRTRPKGRFRRQCAKGIANYSKRNTVESVFHSFKAVHLPSLRSKLWWMKKKEVALAIIVYNLERIANSKKIVIRIIVLIRTLILDRPLNFLCREKRTCQCFVSQI
jgi:hypothetical protein